MIPPRVFLTVAALALAGAGCRPTNPLDGKISAPTPAAFEAWEDQELERLGERERREFVHAFDFIASTMPAALAPADANKTGNPLCRRLDGRTIRSVILEGYDLEKRTLYARISNESDHLIQNASRVEKVDDPKLLARYDRVRDFQKSYVDQMQARLGEIERRVAELTPPVK